MLNRARLFNFLALLLIAAFCFGLVRLLALRYAMGDVFPPYSTLRADPLGARIFYESLGALPGRVVTRNERDVDHLGDGKGTTLFIIGVHDAILSLKERGSVEHFVRSGGRLVISFFSEYREPRKKSSSPTPSPSPSLAPTGTPTPTPKIIGLLKILRAWDVNLKFDNDRKDLIARRVAESPLEKKVPWHSGISFDAHNPDWRPIYTCKRGPVLLERNFGAGSVVLAADSYFLSNEALFEHRALELLSWLAGGNPRVIFDETHLNIHEAPGLMTLLRRYGLSGFILGFFALIILWLWRNASFSLSPRREAKDGTEAIRGRESFAGFVHLLRRGISPGQLLEVCATEWKKAQPRSGFEELENAVAENQRNPIAGYNRILELTNSKKWKTKSAV